MEVLSLRLKYLKLVLVLVFCFLICIYGISIYKTSVPEGNYSEEFVINNEKHIVTPEELIYDPYTRQENEKDQLSFKQIVSLKQLGYEKSSDRYIKSGNALKYTVNMETSDMTIVVDDNFWTDGNEYKIIVNDQIEYYINNQKIKLDKSDDKQKSFYELISYSQYNASLYIWTQTVVGNRENNIYSELYTVNEEKLIAYKILDIDALKQARDFGDNSSGDLKYFSDNNKEFKNIIPIEKYNEDIEYGNYDEYTDQKNIPCSKYGPNGALDKKMNTNDMFVLTACA